MICGLPFKDNPFRFSQEFQPETETKFANESGYGTEKVMQTSSEDQQFGALCKMNKQKKAVEKEEKRHYGTLRDEES